MHTWTHRATVAACMGTAQFKLGEASVWVPMSNQEAISNWQGLWRPAVSMGVIKALKCRSSTQQTMTYTKWTPWYFWRHSVSSLHTFFVLQFFTCELWSLMRGVYVSVILVFSLWYFYLFWYVSLFFLPVCFPKEREEDMELVGWRGGEDLEEEEKPCSK